MHYGYGFTNDFYVETQVENFFCENWWYYSHVMISNCSMFGNRYGKQLSIGANDAVELAKWLIGNKLVQHVDLYSIKHYYEGENYDNFSCGTPSSR